MLQNIFLKKLKCIFHYTTFSNRQFEMENAFFRGYISCDCLITFSIGISKMQLS